MGVDHGGVGGGVAPLATMQLDLMYHASPSHRTKMSPTSVSPTSSYSPLEVDQHPCLSVFPVFLCVWEGGEVTST